MRTLTLRPYLAIILTLAWSITCAQAQFTFSHVGGGPTGSYTANPEPGSFTILGGGNDIWDMLDEFDFLHVDITGDFDIAVKLEAIEAANRWTKAGIMARESMAPESRMAFSKGSPAGPTAGNTVCNEDPNGAADVSLMYRTWMTSPGGNGGQHEDRLVPDPGYPGSPWVRLQREGNIIRGYASADGVTWGAPQVQNTATWLSPVGGAPTPLAATLKVGLGVSRHGCSVTQTATVQFRNLQAAQISAQPQNQTIEQGFPATFQIGLAGLANWEVQWLENGVEIPGATGRSYTTADTQLGHNGRRYSARARDTFSGQVFTSSEAVLSVIPDVTAPSLVSAAAPAGNPVPVSFDVLFSEPVAQASAETLANYAVSGLTLNSATLQADGRTVRIASSPLRGAGCLLLTVNGVSDRAGNVIAPNSTTVVYWDTGSLYYERYNGIAGGAVSQLTGNAKFPNSPDLTEYVPQFETPGGGGDHGENWGARFRGFLTAPESGAYTFAVSSDDQSELWLSTDENPANKVLIAREPEWAGYRAYINHGQEDRGGVIVVNANRGPAGAGVNISAPKTLQRGCRYYVEYLFAEGCCGDYGSVTWQTPSEGPIANGDDPIQAQYISPFRAAPSFNATVPADLTVFANQAASFTAAAAGTPAPTTQWYRNGVAIPGATSATYTIPLAAESDSGATFYAVATSAMGSAQSRTATLTVLVDNQAPSIVSADAPIGVATQFDVVFSEPVNEADAENLGGYSISGGVTLNSAELQADGRTLRFTCTSLHTSGCKMLTHPSIRDRAIPPNMLPGGVVGVVAAVGTIRYHQFNGIDTVNIPVLLADPDFPNNPDVIAYKTSIEGPDNDGGNNFQDYGAQFLGWVHPPVSGQYRFYLAADDHAELYLSTDEDPANKVLIASEPIWANFREWTGPAAGQGTRPCSSAVGTPDTACMNVSQLISLQRGCKYYLEMIFKEDGGGDYGSVTWQLPGGAVPVNGSAPTIVARHLSPFDIPPRTLLEPVDITEQEGRIVTFRANVIGPQLVVQWYRDGVAIPGATALSYTIGPLLYPEDNGARFSLVATNPLGQATTREALLTVIEDTVPPDMIAAAGSTTLDRVTASYNEAMDAGTAGDAFNYSITGGAIAPAVVSATLSADGKTVLLLLDPGTPLELNTDYTVSVNNVNDISGNQLASDSASFHSVVEGCGGLIFEAYNTGGGNAVSVLTSHPTFPNSPDFVTTISTFDSTVAGGVYANNAREAYGARTRGIYVPPYSGDWVFYLRSDDAGELWLNPNGADAAGKILIAEQPGCCNTLGDEAISSRARTLNLVGGQPYYIEALYKEGTGGDYVQVGARVRGSADPVVPIGARDLGQYAVPGLTGTLTIQGPTDQTVDDNRTATFSVTATSSMGLPICYQWYRDGVAIAGANGPSYSFLAVLADNGAVFTVRASIVGNSVDSAGATLTVRIDDIKPRVVSAKGSDTFRNAFVKFNELMDSGTAGDPFNYTMSGGVTVDEADLLADGLTVRLTTSVQTPGTVYQVLVQGALDAAGNVVDENFDTAQFTAFTLSCGLLAYEGYYDIGSGVAVADLLASPKFPWSPDETRVMNMFDTIAILGTSDYRNNSGGRVHGVFIPPASGNWIFYLRSDDASQLFLNPAGIDPAGKVMITEEPACCGPFSAHASAPQALTAGQPYYIEGIYKEGGGGDYIQVAAKLDTDPTAPDNLRGIGSSSIGLYTDPTGAAPITITQHPTDQTACLDPLVPTTPPITFSVAASAVPEGTVLSSQNFNSGNGGYTVETVTAFSGSWVYNLTGGVWRADGQDPELGAAMTSRLTSPPITVNQAGVVRLRLVHRWSYEPGWDGGQVQVSINGGPYTAVSSAAFSENGYNGIVLGNSASALAGQSAFINNSAGHGTGERVTSVAVLGNVNAGATVSVRFLYAGDTNTRGGVPNWEIDSVTLNEGGAEGVPPLVQWQRNNGSGWADIPAALARTYSIVPKLTDNGARFRALIASAGTTCAASDAATLTVIQKNTPPQFALGSSAAANEDAGAQSVPGFASNISPHSIPRNTTLTFDAQPINSDIYGIAAARNGRMELTTPVNSANGAFALNLPAVQTFSTFELSWKSYIGGGAGGGADGYSVSIGDNLAGDPAPTGIGEEGRGDDLIITVDTFNNADIRPVADEGIAIMWGGPYNAGGTELAFQMIPKDNPGNGNYLRKSAFVDARVTVNATGLATLTYDGNTISGQIPGYTGLSANRIVFWARTGNANDNQWIDDVSGSEWINNFLVDTASVEDGQSVSFEVSNDNPALFSAQPAIAPNGTLSYTAAANACGSAIVTVVLRDNGGVACNGDDASDPKTFTITVACVNDCPAATPQAVTAVTGVPLGITLTGTDPDGDSLAAAVASNPSHGSLSVVAGVLTYTATAGYVGPDSFTFTVSDGTCPSGPATVSINVIGNPNLPPTCVASVAPADCGVTLPNSGIIYTIAVDGSSACLALSSAGTTDPDGDSLAISWVIDGTNTLAGAVVTSCLSVGCHTITMTASDGKGGQCQASIQVCVVTPSEAVEQLIALVESTTVERKNKRPLIVSLKAAKDRFESDSLDVGAQMIEVFRHKVKAQISRQNPAEAAAFDAAAAAVITALECSSNLPPRNDE